MTIQNKNSWKKTRKDKKKGRNYRIPSAHLMFGVGGVFNLDRKSDELCSLQVFTKIVHNHYQYDYRILMHNCKPLESDNPV